jgi:competence protein ComEC
VPTIYLSAAWLLGILFGYALHPDRWLVLIGLLPLPAVLLFRAIRKKSYITGSLCCLVFLGAAAYIGPSHSGIDHIQLQSFNNCGPVQVKGMLSRNPETALYGTRLYFSAHEILNDDQWTGISGAALIFMARYPEYHYGEIVVIKGTLGTPSDMDNSDYAAFLNQQGIFSIISYPDIKVVGHDGSPFLRWVYATGNSLNRSLAKLLPEPHASLAQGIALGVRSNIPNTLEEDFTRTGTTHLLAISGVNLTIVAGILVALTLWFFGRRHHIHIWVTIIVTLLYTWLSGFQPPVVRAEIMVIFFLGADLFGRQRNSVIALLLAAVLMTVIDAEVLTAASFQMSFMAMAGLIFITPPVQQGGRNLVERFTSEGIIRSVFTLITDSFSVSLGAVIATWPLVAFYFGIFSWIGPLATFLTLPVLPVIIITALISGGLGLILLPLAQIVAWICWVPLSYLIVTVTWLARIPGISVTANLSIEALLAYYGILIVLLLAYKNIRRLAEKAANILNYLARLPLKWAVPPLALVVLLVWLSVPVMPDRRVHVSFLDVGQGDAILIEQGTQQILIDGGPGPQKTLQALSRKMPFWDRTIDMVVLTHPDTDHLGGLVEVIERYRVKYALSTNTTYDSPLYREWQNTIDNRHIHSILAEAGQRITMGNDIQISVINPPENSPSDRETNMNNRSVVLRVQVNKVSFLLTGDLETDGEKELIEERANLSGTILKVGHHGSASSTSREFLDVVSPDIAVISVGVNNSFGHPDTQVVKRLEQKIGPDRIYRTDLVGTVEFITDGEKLWVRTDKK